MKIWVVQWDEPDGPIEKEPGRTSQKLRRMTHYYAAEHVAEVWTAIQDIVTAPDREFVSLAEGAPSVTVIGAHNG